MKKVIIYINTNAVHHGFTGCAENYIHCSYLALVSNKNTLIEREKVIELFDNVENFKKVIKQKQDIIDELTLE